MTSNTESKSRRRHKPPTRVLAFLLLAFILHGATAEIVHQHGGLSSARRSVINTATPSVSDSGETDSSSQQTRSRNECVICQLHQHLSTTLFSALPWTAPPPAQFTPTLAASFSYFSPTSTAQRGRAPPLASLL